MIEFLAGIAKRVSTLATDYTTARAAKLDNLDRAITAITPIKSIQYGTITITGSSATATLNPAVTAAKSALIFLGTEVDSAAASTSSRYARISLQDGSTVAGWRNSTNGQTKVQFCVVEFL